MQTTAHHNYEYDTNLKHPKKRDNKQTQSHEEHQANYKDTSDILHERPGYTNNALTRH